MITVYFQIGVNVIGLPDFVSHEIKKLERISSTSKFY